MHALLASSTWHTLNTLHAFTCIIHIQPYIHTDYASHGRMQRYMQNRAKKQHNGIYCSTISHAFHACVHTYQYMTLHFVPFHDITFAYIYYLTLNYIALHTFTNYIAVQYNKYIHNITCIHCICIHICIYITCYRIRI